MDKVEPKAIVSTLVGVYVQIREIDFIVVFRGQIWPMRPKNITFSCNTCESQQPPSIFKSFTNKCCNWDSRVHIVTMIKIGVRIGLGWVEYTSRSLSYVLKKYEAQNLEFV